MLGDVGIVLTVAIVNLAVGRRTFRPTIFGKLATATYIITAVAGRPVRSQADFARAVDDRSGAITLTTQFGPITVK